jgi:hypothetical protein
LCRFIQAPLKTKIARWKALFLLGIYEKTPMQHLPELMAYYSRYATRKVGVPLESRSYNKSYPSTKAYCFSEIDDRKPFLVVRIPAWPPLIVLASIIEPYHGDSATFYNFTLLVPVYRLFRGSTLHGVSPLSSHVVMISIVHSYIHHVLMSQIRSSSNALMFDSAWKFLPDRGCRLNLEIWEGSFSFQASTRVVGPRRSNNEVQHKQSHEAQSDLTRCYVAHARKEKLHERPRSFLLRTILISSLLLDQCALHRFLCLPPPFINLKTRFRLRGEGCNTPCYELPNIYH